MSKKLVRKALEMLRKLASGKGDDDEDEEGDKKEGSASSQVDAYNKFWEAFGKSIKMGVVEDNSNRSKLAKLLRFKTSTSGDKWVSLEEYVSNMADWQKDIYFIAGESVEGVKKSPFLEVANKKKIEVIYLTEPVDEYTFQHLGEFDGHKLQSLSKEGLKFGDEDEDTIKKRAKAYKDKFKSLTKYLKDLFVGKVSKVTVSQRVVKSPSVIVTSQYGHTANMERIMRAQTFASGDSLKTMSAQRTLELNPRHPIVVALNKKVAESPDAESTKDLAFHLYDTALLNSGFSQDDLEGFSERMYRTIASQLNVASLELEEELDLSDEEEESDKPAKSDAAGEDSSSHEEL
jgi:heat shock protein beta